MSGLDQFSGQRSRRSGKRGSGMRGSPDPSQTQQIGGFQQPQMGFMPQQIPQQAQQQTQQPPQIQQFPQYVNFSQPQQFMQPQMTQDQFLIQKILQIEKENRELAEQCAKHRERIQILEQNMFDFYTQYDNLLKTHPIPTQEEPIQRQQAQQPRKYTQKIH